MTDLFSNSAQVGKSNRLRPLMMQALGLSRISIWLGWAGVAVFVCFGTLASLRTFASHGGIFMGFYYLPYVLVGLSAPISLYQLFLVQRYRLMQAGMIRLLLVMVLSLSVGAVIAVSTQGRSELALGLSFMALCAWFALPYLLKVSLKRFISFLNEPAPADTPTNKPTDKPAKNSAP